MSATTPNYRQPSTSRRVFDVNNICVMVICCYLCEEGQRATHYAMSYAYGDFCGVFVLLLSWTCACMQACVFVSCTCSHLFLYVHLFSCSESIVSSITGDVNTFVGGLWSLWLELGYKEDICMERLQTARHHLSDLMHEMKTEEEGAVEKLRLVSKLLSEECQDLSEELQISFTKVPFSFAMLKICSALYGL